MCYTIFETFVGAGGAHIGFNKVGFVSKYVNDINGDCLKTLIYNNPTIEENAYVDNTSILDIDPKIIMERTNVNAGDADVLFGGIVCKGFSLAGERSPNDERNYFYHKQLELVKYLKPKISIIENVPGILNATVLSASTPSCIVDEVNEIWKELDKYKGMKSSLRKSGGITPEFEKKNSILRKRKTKIFDKLKKSNYLISVMDDIHTLYNDMGYTVKYQKLNSASFGTATTRERIFIVAKRNDIEGEFEFPTPTHCDENIKKRYKNQYCDDEIYLPVNTVGDALSKINYNDINDVDNVPMNHNPKTVERFKYIPEGESIIDYIETMPEELRISKFYSRGNTMRLSRYKPSPTLVPGHSNFPVHPIEHRSITVREAACITGFPSNYKFFGSHSKRCEHVGNAVPPPLAEALARSVKKLLDYNKSNKE